MRIAVLGPLEVLGDDGAPVSIPGAKERLLLAALTAEAPAVISTDRMIDILWDGESPSSARKSLQVHLVRLRTALEPERPHGSTGRYVVRRGTGYALDVQPDQLDTTRLAALTALGRARLAGGHPDEAVSLLSEALGLWRGEPYADWPDAEFATTERRRLAEIRVSALETLLEARLTSGGQSEAIPELERLVAEEPLRENWWRLLMLALYRAGRQGDALAAGRRARAVLADELGADPGPALRAMEEALLAQDPGIDLPARFVAAASAAQVPRGGERCPYLGLTAYQASDTELFYGRRRLVGQLVARLVDTPAVLVSGPSGAGKSSVVRAGLVPAVAAGALAHSSRWRPIVLTPGTSPVDALSMLTGEDPPDEPVFLVCDQLEELWTLGIEDAERRTFFDAVLGLLNDGIVARCVLVVRGDHVGRLAEHPGIAERLAGGLVLVPPLTDPELREVVQGPAAAVGLRVEAELLDTVVADVLGRVGALPLLSTALVGTWEHRRGDVLTLAGYLEAGGVPRALTRSAEAAYGSLDDEGRAAAHRLLVRLADVDESGALVRRRVPRAELDLDVGDGGGLHDVVEAFVSRRLLSVDEFQVEVTHEALLTAWPRLSRWLEDDATGRAVRRHLAPAAREWESRGRPQEELYRGARLSAVLDWAAGAPLDLAPVERQFLEASRERAEGELRAAREAAAREKAARRRTRRLAAGLAAGLVVALVTTGLAIRSSRDAGTASIVADAGRLATLAETTEVVDVSLLLAVQAMRLTDLPETRSTLLSSVVGHGRAERVAAVPHRINRLMLGPAGTVFFEAGEGELFRWSPSSPTAEQVTDPAGGWEGSLDVSPREPVVIRHDWEFDGENWRESLGLQSLDGPVREMVSGVDLGGVPLAASFTADGARVVVVVGEEEQLPSGDLYLSTWRLVEFGVADLSRRDIGPRVALPIDLIVTDVEDGGRSFVVAGIRPSVSAELVRVADGRRVSLRIPDKDGRTTGFQALPAGAAQLWSDGEVTLYDPDGRPRQTLDAVTGRVAEVVVAPNGTWSATVGSSGAVVLWDIDPATGLWTLREELVGHGGDVVDAEITPDSEQLVTAGGDRRLIVWDASVDGGFGTAVPGFEDRFPTAPPQVVEPGRIAVAPTMPIEAADPVVAMAGPSPVPVAATFFDPVTGEVLQEVQVGTAVPGHLSLPSVSVSPDRSMVAVTTGSTVRVLDSTSRREISRYVLPKSGSEPAVSTCIGWTPDALLVVCVDDVGGSAMKAVDPRNGGELRSRGDLGLSVTAMAADPARNRLAVTGPEAGVVVVLDARTFEVVQTVGTAAITWPSHLSFSPDGGRIAVAGEGGLTVIDTDTWRAAPAPAPLTADLLQAEWFPDSRTMAVAGSNRTVHLYDVEQGHVRAFPLPAVGDESAEDVAVHLLPEISDELVVLGGSQPGRRFPLDPGEWSDFACTVAGRDLTTEEWTRYLPDRPHRPTCSDLG